MRKSNLSGSSRSNPRSRISKLLLLLLLVLSLVASVSQPVRPPVAYAFSLKVHVQIVRDALTSEMDSQALKWVIGHFLGRTGDRGSDSYQFSPERHFDEAPNRTVICQRWSDGFNTFLNRAVKDSAPMRLFWASSQTVLYYRADALGAFGEAAHALADFYSHSNWIELAIAKNQSPGLAPILHSCDPNSLPPGLQTGYFHMSLANGIHSGCPIFGPPAPFKYCHSNLNKDDTCSSLSFESCRTVPGQSLSYHDLAVQLATEATRQLWTEFHDRVMQTYTPETWNVNGECIFNELAFNTGHNCLDLSGRWVDVNFPTGTVEQVYHLATKISSDFTAPVACPYGGGITHFFSGTQGNPTSFGTPIVGSINECVTNPLFAPCVSVGLLQPVLSTTFTALVDNPGANVVLSGPWPLLISFKWINPWWVIVRDEHGKVISCMPDPSHDTTESFLLVRQSS